MAEIDDSLLLVGINVELNKCRLNEGCHTFKKGIAALLNRLFVVRLIGLLKVACLYRILTQFGDLLLVDGLEHALNRLTTQFFCLILVK